jgi:hypothetical protein
LIDIYQYVFNLKLKYFRTIFGLLIFQHNNEEVLMIHGVYIKHRPKGSWHLVSVSVSPEAANQDVKKIISQGKREGEYIEAAIKIFESSLHIPEFLNEVTNQAPMYN